MICIRHTPHPELVEGCGVVRTLVPNMIEAYVNILRCRDGHYYVGSTRGALEKRIAEHNAGTYGGYTKSRRPVALVHSIEFQRIEDAIAAERQLKGWSRAKKEALIAGGLGSFDRIVPKRRFVSSSFDKLRMRGR